MKRFLLVAAIAALAFVGWLFRSQQTPLPPPLPSPAREGTSPASSQLLAGKAASGSATSERSTLADALNSPGGNIAADLQIVSTVLESFHSNFLREGNPVGDNADITAALSGKNPLALEVVPRGHPAINSRGELCDRWGTPFFFHQLSGTRMEIRSAGPDKQLYTADDAVLTP